MNYRCERKFIPAGLTFTEVLALVKRHPALFRETYPERAVNNVYFDTVDLRHYHEHVNGAANRLKLRVRWYGEMPGRVDKPVLEIKVRRGAVNGKLSHPMQPFSFDGGEEGEGLEAALRHSSLPETLKLRAEGLGPSLANRYNRRYFCSGSGAIRLTVDWGLECFDVRRGTSVARRLPPNGPPVIIELKYDPAGSDEAAAVSNGFPFRLTRCSKYVLGIQALGG